ncbi:MAG: TatD family hydrolase [Saprospiraceae bacterium]|nr:TatD family hydrolase [Saprospiraceae bacterium]
MVLIDTHAHLYSEQFEEDRNEVLQRAFEEGVEKIFLPNVDSESIKGMLDLEVAFPDKCYPLMGLHPCSVKENYKEELKIVEKWLSERSFKAVGEIGIDLYWDKSTFEEQKIAFRQQIAWAKDLNIPIIIHARDSIDEIIEIVKAEKDERLTGIFHCFTGTSKQAQQIMDLEFYMGLGGVLTFKKSGLDAVIKEVPMDYLVLETDAPYLAPTPKRGKRNESSYIKYVATKLATVKDVTEEYVAEMTTKNALTVFKV